MEEPLGGNEASGNRLFFPCWFHEHSLFFSFSLCFPLSFTSYSTRFHSSPTQRSFPISFVLTITIPDRFRIVITGFIVTVCLYSSTVLFRVDLHC
ncbi:uncharacterized protein BDW47DRAFT_12737 [Aspergillus candidus]|uniref:Uncharacterized protein n=1 Tax=Aspergillus candidus TaxID=41067 RepID=A0A2I2FFQ2_ASPCN|nr:hypothetical protein BDW47DRAFT_12737 [Aspergillus candidus]PLB39441.1 hypothetical protein BDW47DRAFT_12737 [Aspergillus candidus]